MDRQLILENTLKTNMLAKDVEFYLKYNLTEENILFLQDIIKEALNGLPKSAFNCGAASAILAAMILDNSEIPATVIAGHLDYNSTRLFNCYENLPSSTDGMEIWDGHCWVEIKDLIIDISIFRTIYDGEFPKKIYDDIIVQFGTGHGALLGSPKNLKDAGFIYTPCFNLTENQINGLIRSIVQN
jgi:hypothetical protein